MANTKINQIKQDDLMAFTYWGTVEDVNSSKKTLVVKDVDHGFEFQVRGKDLIENGFSADSHSEQKKVTKTAAAEMLIQAFNRPFSVCFKKADGSERILRGRLIKPEPLLGRSMVEDLDKPANSHRNRQVDHRTIQWIVLEGTKYVVRK